MSSSQPNKEEQINASQIKDKTTEEEDLQQSQEINQEQKNSSHDQFPTEEKMQFDGSDFDFSSFNLTIDQIHQYSLGTDEAQKNLIIENLINKMRSLAHGVLKANQRAARYREQNISLNQECSLLEFEIRQRISLQAKICQERDKLADEMSALQKKVQLISFKSNNSDQVKQLQGRIQSLLDSLKTVQEKYFEVKILKEQDEKIIQKMQEELAIIYKFSHLEENFTKEIKRKISVAKQSCNIKADQAQDLRDYADKIRRQNESLGMITEKTDEDLQENESTSKNQRKGSEIHIEQNSLESISEENINIDQSIDELKKIVWKRSSMTQEDIANEDNEDLEFIQPLDQKKKTFISDVKAQFMTRRITHSKRISSIIKKLDDTRTTSGQYVSQLEEQLQILKIKMQQMKQGQSRQNQSKEEIRINENQKIEQLIQKIEQLEEERIRMCSIYQKSEKNILGKSKQIQFLENSIFKLELQSKQLQENLEVMRNNLGLVSDKAVFYESSLKKAEDKIEQLQKNKSTLQNQNYTLKDKLQNLQNMKDQLQMKYQQAVNQNMNNNQLQQKINDYEQCIEELQQALNEKIHTMDKLSDQKEKTAAKIKSLQQNQNKKNKQHSATAQQLERIKMDYKIQEKKVKDLTYMNELLKKDILNVSNIQNKKWDEEILKSFTPFESNMNKDKVKIEKTNLNMDFIKKQNIVPNAGQRRSEKVRINNSFTTRQDNSQNGPDRIGYKYKQINVIKPGVRQRQSISYYEPNKKQNFSSFTEEIKKKYML